jgi:hypothetical protein
MGMKHEADTNGDGVVSPEEKAAWEAANPGRPYSSGWQKTPGGNGWKLPGGGSWNPSDPTKDPTADEKRKRLNEQGDAAGNFAGVGEAGYGAMSVEAQQARDYLRRLASGQESVSREQLRQGLQQNLSAQRSMAASASPQNAAMAARTAALGMGRAASGATGQAAIAGLQERQAAQQALANMIMQQRQQDLQAALGSRGNAVGAFGGVTPQGSLLDRWANPIASGLAAGAKMGG